MAAIDTSDTRVGTSGWGTAAEATRERGAWITGLRLALGLVVLLSAFLNFYQLGVGGPGCGQPSTITQWIEAHGTVIPTSQWGGSTGGGRDGFGGTGTLYQLSA